MFIPETALVKIYSYFGLETEDQQAFIDSYRNLQLEIFLKTILMYWEETKTEFESKHLLKVAKGLNTNPDKNLKRFWDLITAEYSQNKELQSKVMASLRKFTVNMLSKFVEIADRDAAEEVISEVLLNLDVAVQLRKSGAIDPGDPATQGLISQAIQARLNE